jgi:hypothetical protein
VFDIKIETKKGAVYCAYIKRSSSEIGAAAANSQVQMTVQQAHSKLGHLSEALTRQAAATLGWKLSGTMTPCEVCAIGKANQKNLPKNLLDDENASTSTSKDPNSEEPEIVKEDQGKWFLDIASIKKREGKPVPTLPHWRILVDDFTDLKVSHFFKTKNGT